MTHCCSQCSFTAQFESALTMHRQLHHEAGANELTELGQVKDKSNTVPRAAVGGPFSPLKDRKSFKLPSRTSSATRLFEKLRTRICRSKTLFAHPEEIDSPVNNDISAQSECTSKAHKMKSTISNCTVDMNLMEAMKKETYGCHMCSFDADRITVLDRHLLNDHKIGLENLLKLVMAKTKDGLCEENNSTDIFGIRQPYYKPPDEIIEEGEFIIETVTPKIKVLKHAGVNTDLKSTDIPDIQVNCRMIKKEMETVIDVPLEQENKDELLIKMHTLNECMCKFVNSTNTLKKVLTKGFESKNSARSEHTSGPMFDLGLGDQDAAREWNRPHSEKVERSRSKYEEPRSDKLKSSSESFYF